jgi:hypothetical protein
MWTIAGNLLVSLGSLGVLLAPTVGQAAKVSYQAEGEQQVLTNCHGVAVSASCAARRALAAGRLVL